VQHIVCAKPGQRAVDRGARADAGIEHKQRPAAISDDRRRDLFNERLERGIRQAAAAGVFDKGRIETISKGRPNQRVDAIGDLSGEPFGLDAVGVERQMEAVRLGARADRQNRGGAIRDAAATSSQLNCSIKSR
jgi:hypothetical protein